jgi:predicted ATPase
LAEGDLISPERLAADYGLWAGSYVRSELSGMSAHAATLLGDVEARSDAPEAGVAHRAAGATRWFAGEYREAREHLERALALFQPGRDDDLAFRFGVDHGVVATLYLALTLWPLGDIGRALSLVGDAEARIAGLGQTSARAYGKWHLAMFELMRGDLTRFAAHAAGLAALTREQDLPMWRTCGIFLDGLSRAESGALSGGLETMRRGIELLREQNLPVFDGLVKIVFAEVEARAGDVCRAVAILDEALATSERTGHRAFEAELHRGRGEMLFKRDPADPAAAEEALQTAIGVAKQQDTRSFELRAALALAKLYQSTGRPANAHAVLAPVLEGFSPTPEMPEIAEARTLLVALAESDEVKAAIAQRERRLHLQLGYSRAMMWSKGFADDEALAAYTRARELAAEGGADEDRYSIYYGHWLGLATGGKLQQAPRRRRLSWRTPRPPTRGWRGP